MAPTCRLLCIAVIALLAAAAASWPGANAAVLTRREHKDDQGHALSLNWVETRRRGLAAAEIDADAMTASADSSHLTRRGLPDAANVSSALAKKPCDKNKKPKEERKPAGDPAPVIIKQPNVGQYTEVTGKLNNGNPAPSQPSPIPPAVQPIQPTMPPKPKPRGQRKRKQKKQQPKYVPAPPPPRPSPSKPVIPPKPRPSPPKPVLPPPQKPKPSPPKPAIMPPPPPPKPKPSPAKPATSPPPPPPKSSPSKPATPPPPPPPPKPVTPPPQPLPDYGSSDANWALARIRRHSNDKSVPAPELPADGGKGVHIWMIDSGFDQGYRDEYSLRPIIETEFAPGVGSHDTAKGHGTMVASTICSKKHGVAKAAQLHVIAIGTNGSLIKAFEFVIEKVKRMKEEQKEDNRLRHIIQLSITYRDPNVLDDVVRKAGDLGIIVVNSAGNGNDDACGYSPASITRKVSNMLTVGAIGDDDEVSDFSARGSCVNVFAPGEKVPVLKAHAPDKKVYGVGTSYAAPITTGVLAIYLSQKVYTKPGDAVHDIIRNSSPFAAYGSRVQGAGIVYAFLDRK